MNIKRLATLVFVGCATFAFFISMLLLCFVVYHRVTDEAPVQEVPVEMVQLPTVSDTVKEPDVVLVNCIVVKKPDTEQTEALYNVPLEDDLQRFIIGKAEEIGIDPAVIFAMAQKESTYDPGAVGDNGNSLGLLQIQPRWNMERMERLDCLDLLDPVQNVTVAADLLAELMDKHGDVAVALTVYNNGHYPGYVTDYATTVLRYAEELRNE